MANSLNKFKSLTPEHHIWRVPSKPREVFHLCVAPISKRAVTFTLVISNRFIHFIETPLPKLDRFENGLRNTLPI